MRPSIRYRLIVLLSGAVVTIGAAQAWLCYRGSLAEANIYYDRQMQVLADAVAAAAAAGRLFPTVRAMPDEWPARTVAARVAATLSASTLPSPEPPPLDVQAFHGAALAR